MSIQIDPIRRRLEWSEILKCRSKHTAALFYHTENWEEYRCLAVRPSKRCFFMLVWMWIGLVMLRSFGGYPIFCRILKKPSLQTLSNASCQFDESQIQRLALFSASFLELSYRKDLSYYAQHGYSAVIVAVASVTFIFNGVAIFASLKPWGSLQQSCTSSWKCGGRAGFTLFDNFRGSHHCLVLWHSLRIGKAWMILRASSWTLYSVENTWFFF